MGNGDDVVVAPSEEKLVTVAGTLLKEAQWPK